MTTGTTEEALANAEKLGFETGLFVKHPFLKKKIPVYFANFVLMDYGTGAIFGPAHDKGFDFAKKYKLQIIRVVSDGSDTSQLSEAYTGNGKIVNSDFLNGLTVTDAKEKIISKIEKTNLEKEDFIQTKRLGYFQAKVLGLPIPMIYLEDGSLFL